MGDFAILCPFQCVFQSDDDDVRVRVCGEEGLE